MKPQNKMVAIFQRITTLHGTNHRSVRTICAWWALMIANLFITVSYLIVISHRYHSDQIVTRIDANCKVGQVPFPAVSICNFNMVSLKETVNIEKILKRYNRSQAEISEFFAFLPGLRSFTINQDHQVISRVTAILDLLKRHYYSVDTVMEEVHQPCERLLLYCSFNRRRKECTEIFSLIKTIEGHCCTFNYAALNDDRDILLTDNEVEFYVDPSAGYEQTHIISTSQSGRGSGLSVVFDLEPSDYPPWSPLFSYGAKILLSDPNDYPETTVLYKFALLGKSLDIKVESLIFQCEDEIRRVPASRRGCWFHDEVLLDHTDRYSYETCNTECRMQKYVENCGCIPYKYPSEKLYPTCEFKDLGCLSDYRAYGAANSSGCDPPCFMECRDKKYSITGDVMPLVPDFYPQNITAGKDPSQLSALQVYFTKSTCNCYKQALFIDFNYFIATYGGVFSLSFGASILTLVELLYLLSSFILKKIVFFEGDD